MRIKIITLIIHVAGWLLFLTFPLLFMRDPQTESNPSTVLRSPYYWQFGLCYMALFYVHTYFLFPRFFLRKKYVPYVLVLAGLLAGVYWLRPFDQLLRHDSRQPPSFRMSGVPPPQPELHQVPPRGGPRPRPLDITSLFIFGMVVAISTATRSVQQWQETEKRAIRAEADKANAELSVLKAQIHPHFLFNTLNNIYSLAVIGSEHTAASVMKLSNIMRYVTDEVSENFVPLSREVDCIRDYIDLQRLRLSKRTRVEVEISGSMEHKKIAPLILIPFLENGFKYGVSNHQPSTLIIKLIAEESRITFFCQNPVFATTAHPERTGVGISNTRQRLAHLYPGKHSLQITENDGRFTVQLTLEDE